MLAMAAAVAGAVTLIASAPCRGDDAATRRRATTKSWRGDDDDDDDNDKEAKELGQRRGTRGDRDEGIVFVLSLAVMLFVGRRFVAV
jgi:hypothetical protein